MGYFNDPDFQEQMVTFLCRDRTFLRRVATLVSLDDFKTIDGNKGDIYLVAERALKFWQEYGSPIGGMLKVEIQDAARQLHIEGKRKEKLVDLVERINNEENLAPVQAVEQKIIDYKNRRAKEQAIRQMIDLQEQGQLTDERMAKIMSGLLRNFGEQYKVIDYMNSVEQRVARRRLDSVVKYPFLLIHPIDEHVRALSRGNLGMALAQYKIGKSLFLAWLANAYALQHYKVLYFTLEDPAEEVEDRLDAIFTRIKTRELGSSPDQVVERFNQQREYIKGDIRIVAAEEGGMTVAKMETLWEQQRNSGFNADVVIVDYDDEIEPPQRHDKRTDASRRFEFADIYREMRRFAKRRDIFLWTAAQARRGKEQQTVIRGEDAAEDISKIRKVALCIGIGVYPDWGPNARFLYIAAAKFDTQRVGWPIMADPESATFYDAEETFRREKEMFEQKKKEQAKK